MHIETIQTPEAFRRLEPLWNELLDKSDVDFPFMSFEWITAWWDVFGNGCKLLILVVKENDEAIGILPFMLHRMRLRWFPLTTISFIASNIMGRADGIIIRNKKEVYEAALNYLKSSPFRFDMIQLGPIPETSSTYALLSAIIKEKGIRCIVRRKDAAPYVPATTSWEEYFKTLSKKFRSELRNLDNTQKRNDSGRTMRVYTDEHIDQGIMDLVNISRNTWKYRNGTAIVCKPGETGFYRLFAHKAARRKWLYLVVLLYNSKPVAFMYNILYKNTMFILKVGYDEQYKKLSAGTMLFLHVIRKSFIDNLKKIDMLGKSESFKLRWTPLCRAHYQFCLYNSGLYSSLVHFIESRIVELIKKCFTAFKGWQRDRIA